MYNIIIISIGYKVNSERAIQFRRWATYILKEFSKKGYIIDKKRMANGAFFDKIKCIMQLRIKLKQR